MSNVISRGVIRSRVPKKCARGKSLAVQVLDCGNIRHTFVRFQWAFAVSCKPCWSPNSRSSTMVLQNLEDGANGTSRHDYLIYKTTSSAMSRRFDLRLVLLPKRASFSWHAFGEEWVPHLRQRPDRFALLDQFYPPPDGKPTGLLASKLAPWLACCIELCYTASDEEAVVVVPREVVPSQAQSSAGPGAYVAPPATALYWVMRYAIERLRTPRRKA